MIYLFWTFYTLLNIYLMQFVLADKEIKREARKKSLWKTCSQQFYFIMIVLLIVEVKIPNRSCL